MAKINPDSDGWVTLDQRNYMVETGDGTIIPAEICDNAYTALDFVYIAILRAKQREEMKRIKK